MTGWTLLIASHALAASVAIPLGGWQLFRPTKGDRQHRNVGRVWVVAMLYVAVTSFWIRDLRPGQLSFLHILSAVTLVTVGLGVVAVRSGNIDLHRGNMRGSWFGLLGAFVGATVVPDRLIPRFVVTEPDQALLAAACVAATTVIVIAAGRVPWGSASPQLRFPSYARQAARRSPGSDR